MSTFDQDVVMRRNQAYASPGSASVGDPSAILGAKGGVQSGFAQRQALQQAMDALRKRRTLGPGRGKPSLLDQYLRQQALARKRPNSGVGRRPATDYGVARKPSVTGGTPAPYDGPRF